MIEALPSPFHARLQAAHTSLSRASDVMEQVQPMFWSGLAPIEEPAPSVGADVREFTPAFAHSCQIGARRGLLAATRALFVPNKNRTQVTAYPFIWAWPNSMPTLDGQSLLSLPVASVTPGQNVFLRATWTFRPGGLLDSSDCAIVFSNRNLEDNNDHSPLASPLLSIVTKTNQHHLIGTFDAALNFVPSNAASPLLPFSL